jgi:collagen triple helix repeat protein
MFDTKRRLTTILGISAVVFAAHVTTARATPAPQLVITSATFDEANSRLVISGQNFSWPSNGSGHATPPVVSLDLLPLTVLSATSTEVVASLSGTFPDGTYLITVSRGQSAVDSGAFAVAIYHEESHQGVQGPAGPAGPAGAVGPAGPAGAVGPAGPAGPAGAVGPTGPAGPIGPAGPAGAVGPAGSDGLVGPQGAVGPTGPMGPAGPAGPQGVMGATGPSGPQGVTGPQGAVGAQGPIGLQGVPGVSGYQIVTATNNAMLANGKLMNAKATCPAGTRVFGGGVAQTPPAGFAVSLTLVSSYPDTNQSWFAEFRNMAGFSLPTVTMTVYALCAIAN